MFGYSWLKCKACLALPLCIVADILVLTLSGLALSSNFNSSKGKTMHHTTFSGHLCASEVQLRSKYFSKL